jgi:hydrogenase-4 component E
MTTLLTLIFAITLIYVSISERFRMFATLIGIQGLVLFGLSFLELDKINIVNLIFIIAETLIFKAIVVPYLLFHIVDKTKIAKVHQKSLPSFYKLLFVTLGLIISIVIGFQLMLNHINRIYFVIALFALYTGLLHIVAHKKIFSHLIGFLIIENGVFLLSLAVGNEMPMLINTGILLDIFVSVLILSVFINKIGDNLTERLKD